MSLVRPVSAATLFIAALYGCSGAEFQGVEDSGTSGKTSGAGGKSATGGRPTSDLGGAGSDGDPGSAGEEQGSDGGAETGGTSGSSTGGTLPLGGAASVGGSMNAGSNSGGNAGSSHAGMGGGGGSGPNEPLRIADLLGIDASGMTGFNAAGFRCKSLAVCGTAQNCIYFSEFLGTAQSQETSYTDGAELSEPQAVKLRIAGGAQGMCAGIEFKMSSGESLELTYGAAGGQKALLVSMPEFSGTELTLYVAADGSTYHDAALTKRASPP
jgi:hypothetical protein